MNFVTVGILDTGITPGLLPRDWNLLSQKDFCSSTMAPNDLDGHGTHLASIISMHCPRVNLLNGRIMTHSWLFSQDAMIAGLEWINELKPDILLVSAGTNSFSKELSRVIQKILVDGVLMVASIGNSGGRSSDAGRYPAKAHGVISVGSVGSNDLLSDFSDCPPNLDILAPGEDVYGSDLNGSLIKMSGTSQAAALVAGLIAQVISECRSLGLEYNREKIIDLLNNTGRVCRSEIDGLPKIVDVDSAVTHIRDHRSL